MTDQIKRAEGACYGASADRKLLTHRKTGKFAAKCACGLSTLQRTGLVSSAEEAALLLEEMHQDEWERATT